MNDHESLDHFIDRLRTGAMEPPEFAEMERRLLADPGFRREYRARMRMEAGLISTFQAVRPEIPVPPFVVHSSHARRLWRIPAIAAGIAAAMAIGFFTGADHGSRPAAAAVARLISASEAAWAHGAPGGIGAPLASGSLDLREGLAEIRFNSGVLLSLEAPARLELIDPMRCRLLSGVAVIDVPEGAEGFIVETPEGHVVDHGTRFSVNVNDRLPAADFEVLKGRVSIHHATSGAELSLGDAESARMTARGIRSLEIPPSQRLDTAAAPGLRRIRTHGRETFIIRLPDTIARRELLAPHLLMVKKDLVREIPTASQPAPYARDRRALIGFPLADTAPGDVVSARLLLNLVPTGLGFISCLPETCTFELYGIRDVAELEAWPSENLRWDDAPGSIRESSGIDGTALRLLASVDIPRGRTSGPVVFSSPELADFIRSDSTGEVGFVIVRANEPLDSWSLVHAFAASSHPAAAGPTLELEMTGAEGK